jgi:hypothetical protein
MKGASLSLLYYWIVQMPFFIERSIYWRLDALIPAPIFYFLIFLQDTLDWTPQKKNQKWVFQETNAHIKQALCILKCLPFVEEKIPHITWPFNYTSNVASGLYAFNPCTFLMASCANKIILKIK